MRRIPALLLSLLAVIALCAPARAIIEASGAIWGRLTVTPVANHIYCIPDTVQGRKYFTSVVRGAIADPANYRQSTLPAFLARWSRIARQHPDGSFRCDGLASGRYIVFAEIYADHLTMPPSTRSDPHPQPTHVAENQYLISIVDLPYGRAEQAFFHTANGTADDFRTKFHARLR